MWSVTTVTYQNMNESTPAAVIGTVDLKPVGSTTNNKHIGSCQDRNNECICLVKVTMGRQPCIKKCIRVGSALHFQLSVIAVASLFSATSGS